MEPGLDIMSPYLATKIISDLCEHFFKPDAFRVLYHLAENLVVDVNFAV